MITKFFVATLMTFGVLVLVGIVYDSFKPERWDGYLYPNKHDLTDHISVGEYQSLETCRNAIVSHPKYSKSKSDYKCGLNCDYNQGLQLRVCQEMKR